MSKELHVVTCCTCCRDVYLKNADAVLEVLGWKPDNSDEVELLLALSALYRVNSAPGRHVITFPADPNGKWEYEWFAASPEEKTP